MEGIGNVLHLEVRHGMRIACLKHASNRGLDAPETYARRGLARSLHTFGALTENWWAAK